MKKTFRSILAGALALLAVSCYDDSGLRDDIKKLDERVTALETTLNAEVASVNDLAAKLTAAQTAITNLQESVGTLGTDLAALQSTVNSILPRLDAVDGETDGKIANLEAAIAALEAADDEFDTELAEAIAKIAVTKVEEKEGNVVLTLANGEEVKLSKPMSNVDNNGLVTIVKDDEGVQHWAVVGADGTTEMLPFVVGAAGTIEFKVEDNELMFTLNGEDWATTGAYVAENSYSLLTYFGQKEDFDEDLWDWVTDDFYTLEFGGVEYQLPLYKVDESVVTIKAGKTFFKYGEEKVVEVALTDIKQIDVMSKPDGWRAKLNGKKLTVTAPLEANVVSGASEADGEILFHCITKDGGCKVAKLVVATTAGFSLTLSEDGEITIINPFVVDGDFRDAYIGLATVADFEADHEAYLENVYWDECRDRSTFINNWKSNATEWDDEGNMICHVGGIYQPGVYDVDVINTTIAQMYSDWTYGAELPSSPYILWACPCADDGKPKVDELVFAYYAPPVKVNVTSVSVTPSDVELNISVSGVDKYYVSLYTEDMTYGYPIDEFMTMPMGGPFWFFKMMAESGEEYIQEAFNYLGMPFGGEDGAEMPETIMASKFRGGTFVPNQKFYLVVVPILEGVDVIDYTYEKNVAPYVYEFVTAGLQPGGEATVSLEAGESTFEQIVVNVEASDDATMVFYKFYDSESIDKMSAADVVATGVPADPADGPIVARENVSGPGVEMTLAAVAVDADSKYGEVVSGTFASKSLEYSQTFVATFGQETYKQHATANGYVYDFALNTTGGTANKYYRVYSNTEYSDETIAKLPLGSKAGFYENFGETLSGIYLNAGQTYYLYVVAESITGELSAPIKKTIVVPALPAAE